MGKAALVEQDIKEGKQIVDFLTKTSGEKVPLALWRYDSGNGDWRLVLAVPQMARGPQPAYHMMGNLLKQIRPAVRLTLQDVTLISPNDDLTRSLLKDEKSVEVLTERFLTNTRIGDAYLEGAYIYKVG